MSRVLQTGENQITQTYENHKGWSKGVDIVRAWGQLDNIVAHSEGEVIKVIAYKIPNDHSVDCEGMGYGNYVMIKHDNNIVTLYAHLNNVFVKIGDKVRKGQLIGSMGNTGNSFLGAHLHFEVRLIKHLTSNLHDTNTFTWLNPTPYLNDDLPGIKQSEEVKVEYYRVRKSWDDPKSQLGAYKIKENAFRKAKENPGYYVFDDKGGVLNE